MFRFLDPATIAVMNAHCIALQRCPNATEVSTWKSVYSPSKNITGLIARLCGTSEFFTKQIQGKSDPVTAVYKILLWHDPDPSTYIVARVYKKRVCDYQ
jgi:hypothetical protein